MGKYLYFLFFFASLLACRQPKYTAAQVEKSTDPKVIANFIKFNPDHPKTPEFKRRLFSANNNDKPAAAKAAVVKPVVEPITTAKLKRAVKKDVAGDGPNDKNQRTAELLTHLFNTDPNSKNAYVQIVNKSKCNLLVKISGRKYYNLDVPAKSQNYILVDKGSYTLTTSVCDARYSSQKNINRDIVVTLSAPK